MSQLSFLQEVVFRVKSRILPDYILQEKAILARFDWLLQLGPGNSDNYRTQQSQDIERSHSCGQHQCKFIGAKDSVHIRKEFNSHRTGLGHQHGRRSLFCNTNMAAVTSCENNLYTWNVYS